MLLREAKNTLKKFGYSFIKENSFDSKILDVQNDVAAIIRSELEWDNERIYSLIQNNYEAFIEMVKNDQMASEIASELVSLGDDSDWQDLGESKTNKGKTDKFERKAKLAGKKKCKHCDEDDDDEELDESRLPVIPNKPGREGVLLKIGNDGWYRLLQHNNKPTQKFKTFEYIIKNGGKNIPMSEIIDNCYNGNRLNCQTQLEPTFTDGMLILNKVGREKLISITSSGMKLYKATADYLAGKPVKNLVSPDEYKDLYNKHGWNRYDESIEDIPGLTREPRGQQGTEDWSDFKDEFRIKTAILKTALTNNFISGLIKDFDFEIDVKDIREVAFDNVDAVYGTKNAVKNLQTRVREYFKKMFKK